MVSRVYRGDCEELAECAIDVPEHDCRAHMRLRTVTSVETHGLDCGPFEQWTDEWWECSLCGEREEDL